MTTQNVSRCCVGVFFGAHSPLPDSTVLGNTHWHIFGIGMVILILAVELFWSKGAKEPAEAGSEEGRHSCAADIQLRCWPPALPAVVAVASTQLLSLWLLFAGSLKALSSREGETTCDTDALFLGSGACKALSREGGSGILGMSLSGVQTQRRTQSPISTVLRGKSEARELWITLHIPVLLYITRS